MRFSNFATLLFLVFPACLLFSCSSPKSLEYRSFKNFKIEQAGFASSAITMDIVYYNPNRFGLQLKHTDLDIYVDNSYLGHTTQEYQIDIPKRSEFSIPVKIDVDMKNIFKNMFAALLNSQILIKVDGTVRVGKAHIFMTWPVHYEGTQSFKNFQ